MILHGKFVNFLVATRHKLSYTLSFHACNGIRATHPTDPLMAKIFPPDPQNQLFMVKAVKKI